MKRKINSTKATTTAVIIIMAVKSHIVRSDSVIKYIVSDVSGFPVMSVV